MGPIEYSSLYVDGLSAGDLADINNLLQQLSQNSRHVSYTELQKVLPGAYIAVARDMSEAEPEQPLGSIVGMATLVYSEKLTAPYGTVEDVVVDSAYRDMGIGEKLMERLIETGRRYGLKHIDLTSNPERVAANELYKKLNFELRDTNVYRLKF